MSANIKNGLKVVPVGGALRTWMQCKEAMIIEWVVHQRTVSETRKQLTPQCAKSTGKDSGFARIRPSAVEGAEGFTIVELNVAIIVLVMMSITLATVFTNFIVTSTRTNYAIEMTTDSQNLLRVLVEELRYGAGVRQTNTITDPKAPAGGWNTSNTNFIIITAVPALNASNDYIIDPATGKPYLNEFVYYKQGSALYKRTLANPSASGNKSKTSCPAAAASAACPADRKLVATISTMAFTLYDQDDALTTNPLLARSVKIDLTLRKKTFGTALTFDNSIRTTLRNAF